MNRIPRILQVGSLITLAAAMSQEVLHAQPWQNPYLRFYNAQANAINFSSQRFANVQAQQASISMNGGFPFGGGGGFFNPAFAGGVPFGGVNPYLANPYLGGGFGGGFGGGVGNPYTPGGIDPANPYSPYGGAGGGYGGGYGYPPFGGGPGYGAGQVLMGQADVLRSYGKVINDQEQARITREKALQEQLNTKKQRFDLDMYIKANTPTYTQEQERVAKNTLRRLQTVSLPGEIMNGKALNFILDDLRKFPSRKDKGSLEPIQLSEGILLHLNITRNNYGLGILRDGGRVTWPTALLDRMTVKQRKDLDEQLRELVKGAFKGKVDVATLNRVRAEIDQMRDDLVSRVNDVPTSQYLEAKRFLQEFHEGSLGLERGEAPVQAEFQRFIEDGRTGRSVQDVADFMVKNGLRFGPAAFDDEPAYRAIHSALATYDIAMNADNKEQ